MAALSRLRHHHLSSSSAAAAVRFFSSSPSPSSILNPSDPSSPLSAKQKSRAALSLLKTESDPDRILSICRAASLSPSASHLDRTTLSVAVSRLNSKNNNISAVRSLISDVIPKARHHAIVLFGQANLFEDAIAAFKSSASPTIRDLNALLFSAILAGKHSEIPRLFRDFPQAYNISPNLDTYNTVAKAFCESGSVRSVHSLVDEMVRMKIKPNLTTFNTWIGGLYKEEKVDEVEKVIKIMKENGCHPGLSTYNARIQGLCKIKRPGDAKALFKEMYVEKGIKPNWVTYNHLIFGFASEGDLAESKKLYKEMKSKGCVPDSKCYFTLIFYLCRGGDFEDALDVCKDSMARNWVPSFSTMKMLVNGLAISSKIDEAKELLETVKQKFSGNAEMWKQVEEALPLNS